MKDPVKDQLKRFGVYRKLGEHLFFHTIGEAVKAYLKAYPVPWDDWETRQAHAAE
jgi:hypothetical protein